jgi:hypothetical protein
VDDLDADYDEPTLARLDRAGAGPRPGSSATAEPPDRTPFRAAARRRVVTGSLITGLALGLREVFDPPPDEEVVVEVDVDAPPLDHFPARFEMVIGAPSASRIVLRPWLATT